MRRPGRIRRIGERVAQRTEVPMTIPGLAAWFDSRSANYFTIATGVSAWISRAGSLGAVAYAQGTAANQPTYVSSVAGFANKPAVRFDGTNDFLDLSATLAAQRFLHDGTGCSRILIYSCDSTGPATQRAGLTQDNSLTEIGIMHSLSTTFIGLQVNNGGGTTVNTWNLTNSAHYARDTPRWWMWGYATGTQHSRVSGSSLSNADTGSPTSSNPTRTFRLGANSTGTVPLKGDVVQELWYTRVLSAGETAQIGVWANQQYGVAA